jgi:3-deoxy-D-manno-octulosonic-acid transferase
MWKIVYNMGVLVALPFFTVLSLFNRKLRSNFLERLFPAPADQTTQKGIWIHAASIGESVIAENLVNRLGKAGCNTFVVTTNTHYTRDLLAKKFGDSIEVYSAPLDVPCSIRHFIGSRHFDALLIVETEIWPNTIWMAKSRHIPVIIVNGRISDSTIGRYRRLSFFLRPVLASVDLILAQSDEHAGRFLSLGVDPAKVVSTGNLKYFRDVEETPDGPSKEDVVTFGSVKEKELAPIMDVIDRLRREFPAARFYVAPRELRLIDEIENQLPPGLTTCRYSRLKQSPAGIVGDVVIVDTVGDLLQIYGQSTVAFVGGSLAPYGGQNLLEPLFVRTPVIFGPYVENFKAVAEEILTHGAGMVVHNGEELFCAIRQVLNDTTTRQRLVDGGHTVLNIQKGAMERTSHFIVETIWKNSTSSCS